jgi:hypothetical protein
MDGGLAGLWATLRWRRARRDLRQRLHQLEVDLVKLTLDVRQLEQNVFAADLDELRRQGR